MLAQSRVLEGGGGKDGIVKIDAAVSRLRNTMFLLARQIGRVGVRNTFSTISCQ